MIVPWRVATLEGTFFVARMIDIPAQANTSRCVPSLTCGTHPYGGPLILIIVLMR